MDTRRATPRYCLYLTLALIVLGVSLRTVCMLCLFDADPGYFSAGILPTVSNALYFVAVALPVVCALATPRSAYPTNLITPRRPIPAVGLGAVLAIAALLLIPFLVQAYLQWQGYTGVTFFAYLSKYPSTELPILPATRVGFILPVTILLGLAAAVFYCISASRPGRYPDWLSFLGFTPVLWSITSIGDIYFDPYVTMNSPVKISLHLGLLGFMFICLGELRFRVGRFLPRYATIFWAIGSYTCLTGSVPVLAATGAGLLNNFSHLLYAAVLLFAGLYGLYLLFCYTVRSAPASPHTAE